MIIYAPPRIILRVHSVHYMLEWSNFILNTLLTVHEALFLSFFFKLYKFSNNNPGFFKLPSGSKVKWRFFNNKDNVMWIGCRDLFKNFHQSNLKY